MAAENPRIVDQSTLTGVFTADTFLQIGVEGHMTTGSATIALPETIDTPGDADDAFGADSSLAGLVKLLLGRGVNRVIAVASDPADVELDHRKTAWQALADDPSVRIRLSDTTVQADQVALADSCEAAETIDNKQFCVVAMATPSSKATLSSLAGAVASKRGVVVGPGVYDTAGNLVGGASLAAIVAAEIAKNPDISDSLNTYEIPATAGIEKEAATGLPLFRLRSTFGGAPVDDFQDLLDDGVSPIQQAPSGLAAFTHLRSSYTVDDTFDSLQTLLIKDQLFLDIRENLRDNNMLRLPNTADNRTLAAALTDAYLKSHDDWVSPVQLTDGSIGYGVTTQSFPDGSGFTLYYYGEVVRGTNRIDVAGTLQIPV